MLYPASARSLVLCLTCMSPSIQYGWYNSSTLTPNSLVTCTIWFDGGGGTWMQAPKYGTSRNSVVRPSSLTSNGTIYPGRRTCWPSSALTTGASGRDCLAAGAASMFMLPIFDRSCSGVICGISGGASGGIMSCQASSLGLSSAHDGVAVTTDSASNTPARTLFFIATLINGWTGHRPEIVDRRARPARYPSTGRRRGYRRAASIHIRLARTVAGTARNSTAHNPGPGRCTGTASQPRPPPRTTPGQRLPVSADWRYAKAVRPPSAGSPSPGGVR